MHEGKRISLDARLNVIADMVGLCRVCADIGCDHGRLGAFLLQNRRCERVYLTDISRDSLDKARRLLKLLGYEDRVGFLVGDGAKVLPEPVDAAVIAGMGGETIAEIVEGSCGRLEGATLVLQPNVAARELRERLNAAGWRIADEALARDGRRIYPVIKAIRGTQALGRLELAAGPVLLERKDPLLKDYAAFVLNYTRRALNGAKQGGDAADIQKLEENEALWEEISSCL